MTVPFYGSIDAAFCSPLILPGSIVSLDFGKHQLSVPCTISGVVVRSMGGGINGGVVVNSDDVTFNGLEIFWDGWSTRFFSNTGSNDPVGKTISGKCDGLKFVNCVIHDLSGCMLSEATTSAEMYGCVIYNIGWMSDDRGHGHGLYLQNGDIPMNIKDCIIFNNFGWGVHAYTSGGRIDNILLDGNTCFNNGSISGEKNDDILVGGERVANNPILTANMTYGGDKTNIGYSAGAVGVVLKDNYFSQGITKVNCEILSEEGNVYGIIGNAVFVRPNDYTSTRANVTIYNEAGEDSVTVDLTTVTGLEIGDTVTAWNVQAGAGNDLQTLTLDANKCITVDMQAANRSVAAPIGWTAPATTFPTFGCFIVNKA